jgi:aminoglycoside 3-N-acetyltransferase
MRMRDTYAEILDRLEIEPEDCLFVHSSMDWLSGGVREALEWIEALLLRIGVRGTLFMPSYIWRGAVGRPPEGTIFDVRSSPSSVGLMSEVFRRMPETLRSEHYWVPVCGQGRHARDLLAGQVDVIHPFGEGSTFSSLLDVPNAKLVGLGVSLNTSSLSHLADYELDHLYPRSVFSDEPIKGAVRTFDGSLCRAASYVVRPEVIDLYKPSRLFDVSPRLKAALRTANDDRTIRFAYPVRVHFEEGVRIAKAAFTDRRTPEWLVDYFRSAHAEGQ